jgi:hypothetical protein
LQRVQPDSLNKILYQYHARTGQLLPFDEIFSELRQQAQALEALRAAGIATSPAEQHQPSSSAPDDMRM